VLRSTSTEYRLQRTLDFLNGASGRMRFPSLAVRIGGILAIAVGSVAIAFGTYSLYGLVGTRDSRGFFNLLLFGCFLLGLGIPAFVSGVVLVIRPPTEPTQIIAVPRSALLASGLMMLGAAALMTLAPVLGYTTGRPNMAGMAIIAALGFGFIRSSRKRNR